MAGRNSNVTGTNPSPSRYGNYSQQVQKNVSQQRAKLGQATRRKTGVGNPVPYKEPTPRNKERNKAVPLPPFSQTMRQALGHQAGRTAPSRGR